MKHEWKIQEKAIYLPKAKPDIINVPAYKFFMMTGEGNPNDDFFGNYIEVLYALSYAVKMSPKSGLAPEGYYDYTVYPLEGVWDLSEDAKNRYAGTINKDDLVFNLMIRQPDFITEEYALEILERVKKKKPGELIKKTKFGIIEEGKCVQMMHVGSYDDEPASFAQMEEFCTSHGFKRTGRQHREIYLSDARKVSPEKLRTVLRFQVG
jgi:hypothetical protein